MFSIEYLSFVKMLSNRAVVLDIEGFQHKNQSFVIKELSVCTEDYLDNILFLPPRDSSTLKPDEIKSFNWLTNNLHGIDWSIGSYPYIYLPQILQSVCLRNPRAKFFAKGLEKSKVLSEFLNQPVTNLDDLGCPKIDKNPFVESKFNCPNHQSLSKQRCQRLHCTKEKSQFFFNWLTNERGIDEAGGTVIPGFSNLRLY